MNRFMHACCYGNLVIGLDQWPGWVRWIKPNL
jgi:hypothetical protein